MHKISVILSPNKFFCHITRNVKSALYITGDKAQHMFVAVHPHINFEKTLENKDELLQNISRRCQIIDFERLEKRYLFFKTLEEKKTVLEKTRDEINTVYTELAKEQNVEVEKFNQIKLHKHVVKEELKSLKEYLYGLEENVMTSILNLPNVLHELTPKVDKVIHEFLDIPSHQSKCHIDIGAELNFIKLVDEWGCYLKSEAALFELSISNYFIDNLIESKFIQFQNADFTRSIVVEGCGKEVVNNREVLTIYEPHSKNEVMQELSRLHLTGSASTHAFMAYFAKHLVNKSLFPLKYLCYGREYNGNLRKNNNLFNLNQESVLNIFIATLHEDPMEIFKTITDDIIKTYDKLGYHYRLVYLSPPKLNRNESLRLSIQMFSNHFQEYVEVGYLSYYDSYISERLLFNGVDKNERIFPKVIGGNILNVQKMLGCLLENGYPMNKSVLNDFLRQYLP